MQFSMVTSRGAFKPDGIHATKQFNKMNNEDFNCEQCENPDTWKCTSSAAGHHDQLAAHIDHLLEESWSLPYHKPLIWNRQKLHSVGLEFKENLHFEKISVLK